MRQLIRNFISGWLAAQFFLVGLLLLDVGGFGLLVWNSDAPLLPIAMLSLSLGMLVGVASMGTFAPPLRRGWRRDPLPLPRS